MVPSEKYFWYDEFPAGCVPVKIRVVKHRPQASLSKNLVTCLRQWQKLNCGDVLLYKREIKISLKGS
jgi:hypothetical protein